MNYTKTFLCIGIAVLITALIVEEFFAEYPYRNGGPFWSAIASNILLLVVGLSIDLWKFLRGKAG